MGRAGVPRGGMIPPEAAATETGASGTMVR
jgi:hypothetical protein